MKILPVVYAESERTKDFIECGLNSPFRLVIVAQLSDRFAKPVEGYWCYIGWIEEDFVAVDIEKRR